MTSLYSTLIKRAVCKNLSLVQEKAKLKLDKRKPGADVRVDRSWFVYRLSIENFMDELM